MNGDNRRTIRSGHVMHVVGRPGGGYAVWLDTLHCEDGVRIGGGETRDEAIADAMETIGLAGIALVLMR